MSKLSLLIANVLLLKAGARRGVGQHLCVAAAVERDEQEGRFVDRAAAGDHAVVLQDDIALGGAERAGDTRALLGREDGAAVPRVHGQVVIEAHRVLEQHLDGPPEAAERLTVHRVGVTRRVEVRPRLVDLAVDGERRRVDSRLRTAGEHFSPLVHENKI